jgi:hypothetical protein
MALHILPPRSRLVREQPYVRELAGLILAGREQEAGIGHEMERDILNYNGYPLGSYDIYLSLIQMFPSNDWQYAIAALERDTPGGAFRALRSIEKQRIYVKSGVAIVYTIVSTNKDPIFVLHTLNICEGRPLDFLVKMLLMYP